MPPAVREMPMQGIAGISVLIVSGVGLPQAGFTEPSGKASFSGCPQLRMICASSP